jgi:acetyltransferase-like isoleucine patch superfamily enzyme
LKILILKLLQILYVDKIISLITITSIRVKIKRYEQQCKCKINFISQGMGGVSIVGNLDNFKIASTSHLKSNTYIDCIGGVEIGEYFHTGKDLVILSTNHNYEGMAVPYDETYVKKPVVIKDFVWFGIGVKVLPGVTIGEGVVVGMGSIVTKSIPPYAVVGGNPAQIIKYRNIEEFKKLKKEKKFY